MTWMKVHDLYHNHPKVKRTSMAARGLWVTCLSWQAAYLTDGIIPHRTVKELGGTDPQIRSLVNVGLWRETETEDGELAYEFHDWLHHQQARETILKERARKAKEKADQRARGNQGVNQGVNQGGNQGVNQGVNQGGNRTPNRTPNCTPNSPKQTTSDLRGSESVSDPDREVDLEVDLDLEHNSPTGSVSTRPPGGAHTKTETRNGNTTTPSPSPSDSAPAPDNSAPSSRNQEPVVDMSATRKEPSDHNPGRYADLPHKERLEALRAEVRQQRKEQSA